MKFRDFLFYYHGVIIFGVGVILLLCSMVFITGDYVCQVRQIDSQNYSFNISCFEVEMWCNEHRCRSDRLGDGRPVCYCNVGDMLIPMVR